MPGYRAESDLERAVATKPALLEGLRWGKPRKGHPEGSVGRHVADLLHRLDRADENSDSRYEPAGRRVSLDVDAVQRARSDEATARHASPDEATARRASPDEGAARRADFRLIALVHDSFKYQVRDWRPKRGENHHAMRARRFAERFTDDERLLSTIELHDRPYAIWRRLRRTGRVEEEQLETMLANLPDFDLFLHFVELDGSAEGKAQEPVAWLRDELSRRGMETGAKRF